MVPGGFGDTGADAGCVISNAHVADGYRGCSPDARRHATGIDGSTGMVTSTYIVGAGQTGKYPSSSRLTKCLAGRLEVATPKFRGCQ